MHFSLYSLTYDDSHLWSDIRHNDVKSTSSNMDVSERRVMMLRFTVFVFLLIHANGQADNGQPKNVMINANYNKNTESKFGAIGGKTTASLPGQTHQPQVDQMKISTAKAGGLKPPAIRLSETKECANDIIKYCNPKIHKNNFAILDCLQNDLKVNTHFNWIFHAEFKENNDI